MPKNTQAKGIDDIPAEFIESGGLWTMEASHNLVLCIWNQEQIQQEWSEGVIYPIHKKMTGYATITEAFHYFLRPVKSS